MHYVYKPKETKPPVDEDAVVMARSQVALIRWKMDEAKRNCTATLKQLRKELIATKMWLRRNDPEANGKAEVVSPFD